MHGVSWAFPTVSYLCLHEGLEAPDFMMSHFLAVSLRTRVLPVCLLGLGPALGGWGGLLLLPVLPVSQGPGEADWGLSLVAVLLCWGGSNEQVSGCETCWMSRKLQAGPTRPV